MKPGVAVNLNQKLSFVAHVGFAGWKSVKAEGANDDSHVWGVDLDGNTLHSVFTTTSKELVLNIFNIL